VVPGPWDSHLANLQCEMTCPMGRQQWKSGIEYPRHLRPDLAILTRSSGMDFHHKEILKRYARMATGRPFAPILLNILITSVCDMRCVHCFFTDELDDKPRKKLQMTAAQVARISETLGANLGVLI